MNLSYVAELPTARDGSFPFFFSFKKEERNDRFIRPFMDDRNGKWKENSEIHNPDS